MNTEQSMGIKGEYARVSPPLAPKGGPNPGGVTASGFLIRFLVRDARKNRRYRDDAMAKARACGFFYPGFRREFVAIARAHSRIAVRSLRDARSRALTAQGDLT